MGRMQQLFLAGLLTAGFASTAAAATAPSTGLGQAWPNATDVSASPNFHVYVFERLGVRYVQIFSGGGNFEPSWDAHWDLKGNHEQHCAETDKPIAGLIKDLKSRGLFESTLIVWHGEFGRLPISERMDGRDHNNQGFSVWLAGGGVKGGTIVGATDQYGYRAVENTKTVYELHATILHLLGLDHERLTFHYQGRNFRLTDVYGNVVPGLMS